MYSFTTPIIHPALFFFFIQLAFFIKPLQKYNQQLTSKIKNKKESVGKSGTKILTKIDVIII